MSIKEIVKFKKKYRDELLKFRREVDALSDRLVKDDRPEQAVVAWKEKMELEISTITKLMNESRWQVAWGSLKAMLDMKRLGAVEALGAVGVVAAHVPVSVAAGGMAVAGVVEIATQVMEHGRRKRRTLDGSAFSYLLSARADGFFE